MKIKPKTNWGKWSLGLNALFLIVLILSIILVHLGILDFNNTWWDITVAIIFPVSILAFILGIIAIRKKDNSLLVYLSTILGLLIIIFIFLHSLFISD